MDASFTDAAFESLSALTTTGATVIVGLDDLPRSILFYRQLLQWFGGRGIIVLAVAILPMLGIGGMQLYRAESPGPVKDNKLTPRITETAKALWYLYLGITLACAFSYWVAGMTPFDAICHSFSTVAIGGFSTHDASLGFFEQLLVAIRLGCVLRHGFIGGLFVGQGPTLFHSIQDLIVRVSVPLGDGEWVRIRRRTVYRASFLNPTPGSSRTICWSHPRCPAP